MNFLLFSAYKDEDGKPWVLPFVLRIENEMLRSATYNHEYILFLGMDQFTKLVPPIVLGEDSPALKSGRVSIDNLYKYDHYVDRDSSVGIATRCRLDGPGWIPGGGEIFRVIQTSPGGPPSLLYNGYRFFPRGKVDGTWR